MSRETADRVSGFFPSTEREYIKSTYNMLRAKKIRSRIRSDHITSVLRLESTE